MEEFAFLDELVIVAAAGVLAALIVRYLRLPAVAGLLLAGAVVGPSGLGLVHDPQQIGMLAEVGVIFLLFTIGLEFSLTKLRRIARMLAVGGALQVALTIVAVVGVALARGESVRRGVFFGFVAALSSTAIVLRGLAERRELDAPHGKLIVGALIFQDLCVIPMMLVVPILGGTGSSSWVVDLGWALGKAAVVVVVTVIVARALVPRLFARVDAVRSREVFLLAVLVVCVGTAWLTAQVGLSLALGAFVAGVVLAESDFGHRALADVLPLRDLFASLFFISLGMLFDARVVLGHPLGVALLFAALFFGKGFLATISALPLRFPLRVAVLAGVGLAQFGEFGFVLAKAGLDAGIIQPSESAMLLSAGILTMFVTPVAMRFAPSLAAGAARLHRLSRLLGVQDISDPEREHVELSDHVIIGGYGIAGQVLARALRSSGVPYLVLELNADRVRTARLEGEPIYYGDVSSEETLAHAAAERAKAVVLLINDPEAARRALRASHRHAPGTPVLLRTHYASDREELIAAGAADVVCEEIESGVEMLARVLRRAGFPRNVLVEQLQAARNATQPSAREHTVPRPQLRAVSELDELKVESFLVRANAHARGRSPSELRLRTVTGALVVAVRRQGRTLDVPPASEVFQENDVVFLMGAGPSLARAIVLLEQGLEAVKELSEREGGAA